MTEFEVRYRAVDWKGELVKFANNKYPKQQQLAYTVESATEEETKRYFLGEGNIWEAFLKLVTT